MSPGVSNEAADGADARQRRSDWLREYRRDVTSQDGEDGIIEQIVEIVRPDDGWCVELGAAGGKWYSNTWNLIVNRGWWAVLIEAEAARYRELLRTHSGNTRVCCVHARVGFEGRESLDHILAKASIPKEFSLLSIDVDGNDYHIWNSVRAYAPKIVVIEFNPAIPVDIEFVQPRDLKVHQGSSLLSLWHLAKGKGYELVATTGWNAMFVKRDYFRLFGIADNAPGALHADTQYQTRLFQLYDGTLMLTGCNKLLWHDTALDARRIQVLPRCLRRFPPDRGRIRSILWRAWVRWNRWRPGR